MFEKISHRLFETVRRPFRVGLRRALQLLPSSYIVRIVSRIRASRFWKTMSWLVWGREIIDHRGVRIEINPGEVLGYYTYFLGSRADAMEVETLIELCKDARVFVDVGANAGWFTLAIAHACPELTVYAFEPDSDMVAQFRRNLWMNDHLTGRVKIIEQAVGDVDGTAVFEPSASPWNPSTGRVASRSKRSSSGYDVPIVRLDSFFQNRHKPDVVKVDVEGGELQALRGMKDLFANGFPKAILLETHAFHFGSNASEFNSQVISELRREGFTISKQRGNSWEILNGPLGSTPCIHLLALRE